MEKRHPNHPGEVGLEPALAERFRTPEELHTRARALRLLDRARIPFLVGGAYAFSEYTGIYRDTKDLDLFLRQEDALSALAVLGQAGWRTERMDETWIYKAFHGEYFVDLIFSSGNGVASVDDDWFRHAHPGRAFHRHVGLIPPEELIWSKAFVLERERFDGADVCHVLRARGPALDWQRLLQRFDRYWEVLLSHLMLFRFAYPADRASIPDWVMSELLGRTLDSMREEGGVRMCRGNLLSRVNYAIDIREWGYADGRKWDERDREREAMDAAQAHAGLEDSGGRGG